MYVIMPQITTKSFLSGEGDHNSWQFYCQNAYKVITTIHNSDQAGRMTTPHDVLNLRSPPDLQPLCLGYTGKGIGMSSFGSPIMYSY